MEFEVKTRGHYDFINITEEVASAVRTFRVRDGVVFIFVSGSTAALTTLEYESGLIEDLKSVFEKWAPESADYKHHKRWGDKNGAAHIKSAIVGTDLIVPLESGNLRLGTWQQIVLVDFDERPRIRDIVVQVLGIEKDT